MTYDNAKIRYNDIVKANIGLLETNPKNEIMDPDKYSNYDVEVNGLKISLSQDGLCSIGRIREFSTGKELIKNYLLIRENMFDCLKWPAYSMSI